MSHNGSHDKYGKVVYRPCSSCISSVKKSNRDFIKFSLSITEQKAIGFILAWSLALLHFKANYEQDPRIEFEERKKEKYKGVEKFIEKMKEIQEKAKATLEKAQEDMKKYTNRKRVKVDEYKIGDLVMLSTKDLKYQMVRRRTEKLTERFVRPSKYRR